MGFHGERVDKDPISGLCLQFMPVGHDGDFPLADVPGYVGDARVLGLTVERGRDRTFVAVADVVLRFFHGEIGCMSNLYHYLSILDRGNRLREECGGRILVG